MVKLYDLAGDASTLMNRLVEQIEAFAREACTAALEDATGQQCRASGPFRLPRVLHCCQEDCNYAATS